MYSPSWDLKERDYNGMKQSKTCQTRIYWKKAQPGMSTFMLYKGRNRDSPELRETGDKNDN